MAIGYLGVVHPICVISRTEFTVSHNHEFFHTQSIFTSIPFSYKGRAETGKNPQSQRILTKDVLVLSHPISCVLHMSVLATPEPT